MNQAPVYRQLALPVPVFDYIKDYQRGHFGRTGEHLTIAQVVSAIVKGYQQLNEEREVHEKASKQAALLHSSR